MSRCWLGAEFLPPTWKNLNKTFAGSALWKKDGTHNDDEMKAVVAKFTSLQWLDECSQPVEADSDDDLKKSSDDVHAETKPPACRLFGPLPNTDPMPECPAEESEEDSVPKGFQQRRKHNSGAASSSSGAAPTSSGTVKHGAASAPVPGQSSKRKRSINPSGLNTDASITPQVIQHREEMEAPAIELPSEKEDSDGSKDSGDSMTTDSLAKQTAPLRRSSGLTGLKRRMDIILEVVLGIHREPIGNGRKMAGQKITMQSYGPKMHKQS